MTATTSSPTVMASMRTSGQTTCPIASSDAVTETTTPSTIGPRLGGPLLCPGASATRSTPPSVPRAAEDRPALRDPVEGYAPRVWIHHGREAERHDGRGRNEVGRRRPADSLARLRPGADRVGGPAEGRRAVRRGAADRPRGIDADARGGR